MQGTLVEQSQFVHYSAREYKCLVSVTKRSDAYFEKTLMLKIM